MDNIIANKFSGIKTEDADTPKVFDYVITFKDPNKEPVSASGFVIFTGGCVAVMQGKGDFQFLSTWDSVESIKIV